MRGYSRRTFLVFGGTVVLGACTAAPRSAAFRSELMASIRDEEAGVSFYPVDSTRLEEIARWPVTGLRPHSGWPARGNGPGTPVIAQGDRLDLRIWDSEVTSLITAPGEQATEMNNLLVSPTGHVFLPYVDEVHVAGLTPDVARRRIQERMESIVPSAQVQLTIASGRRNSVDMVSGVASPGSYPMEERDLTLLNMLARAGGVPDGMRGPRVRLMRGAHVYEIPLAAVYEDPARDIVLRGNDRVIVEADKRQFIALGATGTQQVVDFTDDRMDALRAVALMAGVNAARADPKGVLILRRYPPGAVGGLDQPPTERVIFGLDLTTADGLFSAGEFDIRARDVVLATESQIPSFERVLRLFGSTLGTVSRIDDI